MPTISQLPSAGTVSAADVLPISQGGLAHSVSVGVLLAQTQPAIIVAPPSLLGRFSMGPGGPDTIAIGDGLALNSGTLSSSLDPASLLTQTTLSPNDQIVVANAGTVQLLAIDQVRGLFTAGANITIDGTGIVSASALDSEATYSLTALSTVGSLASGDLVGVSQDGQDHTISYGDLIDGLTIDSAQAATTAADSDTFWVAQSSNVMVRQDLGALWPWISGKLSSWMRPVIELSANTTLGTVHNNAILVCSGPVCISAAAAEIGSGFSCELINASSETVTFAGNILTSNGSNGLAPCQCSIIQCVSYSGGTTIFASISAGNSAATAPGQPSDLVASSVTSASMSLSWSAPTSGGDVSMYSVQYRVAGTTPWLIAGLSNGSQVFAINALQASTSYNITVSATNNVGTGPLSPSLTVSTLAS
jgi:hypothetical protein